jgi:hypothetical protein
MRMGFYSAADNWTLDGEKITSPEKLSTIQKVLENEGPIIVEHWFYRGSSSPERYVFDDFEDFEKYLKTHATAGDRIDIWHFSKLCTSENRLAFGKCPDDLGRVPEKGAY